MKNAIMRMLALCLCVMMAISLAACNGGTTHDSDKTDNDNDTVSATDDTSSTANIQAEVEKFDSLDAFLQDETVKQQLDQTREANNANADEQMTCDISSEGDTLVYTYTFKPDVDTEGMADLLETEMTKYTSTFTNIANALADAIDGSNPQVKLVYQDSKGNQIFTKTFSPDGGDPAPSNEENVESEATE